MAIPDYQTLMLPLLRLASDGTERRFRDAVEAVAAEFQLSADERSELLPSGTAPTFDNRVGWARTYLKQAGLIDSPKRGVLRITERGRMVLSKKPARVDVKLLDQFQEFREFRTKRTDENDTPGVKLLVSVRYSPEVVAYVKSTGEGCQAWMDGVLKQYVQRHSRRA